MKSLWPYQGLPAYLLRMIKILPTSTLLCFAAVSLFSPRTASSAGHSAQLASAARDTNIVIRDPRSFKCICYSGYRDGQAPGQSEPNETQVKEDLVLLKKFTHEIRTYGCGKGTHGNFVPKLADEIGLTVHLGIWVDATYDDAANLAAVNDAIALINEGHKSIKSVVVGNEYMLRVRHPEITPTPNIKPDKVLAEANLVKYVKLVKAGIPKSVQVTSADTWSEVNADGDALLSSLDYVTWHLHPWWENQTIGNAVTYLASCHKSVVARLDKIGGKRLVLGETGWPTLANHGGAVGSPENQTRFFKELTVWGWNNNAEFWSFTGFDESWKNAEGSVGGHWGFWTAARQPLHIINNIATLMPKYMQSENPDATVGLLPAMDLLRAKGSAWSANPTDALGRNLERLSSPANGSAHGRVLLQKNGSTELYIQAP
jgi:exo-beta-1,3-glucanase (GH17 family)